MSATEPTMFWADAPWIVEASKTAYGERVLYGPFYNADVAHAWASDMKFESARIRRVSPPPNHVRTIPC